MRVCRNCSDRLLYLEGRRRRMHDALFVEQTHVEELATTIGLKNLRVSIAGHAKDDVA
jgi:hypothetical protein